MTGELAYLSATEALERFRRRELSPLELLEAVIARAEATEPVVNALTDTYFDEARARAKGAAEAYVAGTARPLEGLPIAIKDETAIEGQRLPSGSLLHKDEVADTTDVVARRILDAGGIVHARTAAPEFSMAIVTWSRLNGISRNPWNRDITCGGSSGGAGASLAAGSTTLANGSDIGGSIRIPAAMNGVVGFKPPFGRVGDRWPWNRDPYLGYGPLARTVADAILLQNVIAGPVVGDLFSLAPYRLPGSFPPVAGMRIALSPDLGYVEVDDEIVAALEAVAVTLRELGANTEWVELSWDDRAMQTALTHFDAGSRAILESYVAGHRRQDLTAYMAAYFDREPVSIEQWIASWQYGDEMFREIQETVYLAGFDVLVCPTVRTTSIPADLGHPDGNHPVDFDDWLADAMTYPFNVLGKLPVVDIPIGFDRGTGVPIGLQIVGPVEQDAVPFRVAAALEAAQGPLFERIRPEIG